MICRPTSLVAKSAVCSLLFLTIYSICQAIQTQCISNEIKTKWRTGRYQEVFQPLMDCRDLQMTDAEYLEWEYMVARTFCNLTKHKERGCEVYESIQFYHGASITVDNTTIDLVKESCCAPPREAGVKISWIRRLPRPFSEIINDVERDMGNPASHATRLIYFNLIAKNSRKCLDVAGNSQEDSARLNQYGCHGGDNQQWRLIGTNDGYVNIVAKHSGKCLDVAGNSQENSVNVIQYSCHGGDNQKWQFIMNEDGYYSIVAKHSDKCLDVAGNSQEDSVDIHQYECHGGDNQRWTIVNNNLRNARIINSRQP